MEYNFVKDLPEDHVCQICTNLLNEPQLTDCCGQNFCHTCLDRWFRRQSKKQCPHCRNENFTHILNKPLKRKISELKINCSNRWKGCCLTLKLEEIERHLSPDNPNGCRYTVVKYPNKCRKSILRKDMEDHCKNKCPERKVRCNYCNKVGLFSYVTSTRGDGHVQQCQGYPVDCPNKCEAKGLKRKDLNKHSEVCPLEPVWCPFREAGCKERVVRKDLDNHLQSRSQQHLLNLIKAHAEFKKDHYELKRDHEDHLILKTTVASIASQLKDIQETVKDKTLATSLEKIETKLKQVVLQMKEEGDKLIFRIPCDSWDWVSPTFRVVRCRSKTMYLKANPQNLKLHEEYYGTLSLILVSGDLNGQYEIKVETECEEPLHDDSWENLIKLHYHPIINICTKCFKSKSAPRLGNEIGRVSLPQNFEGRKYKSCKITLTLKPHHCH